MCVQVAGCVCVYNWLGMCVCTSGWVCVCVQVAGYVCAHVLEIVMDNTKPGMLIAISTLGLYHGILYVLQYNRLLAF